eukprot:scaffold14511_cov93-Cylindrotheca_fusiformis.AAC.1
MMASDSQKPIKTNSPPSTETELKFWSKKHHKGKIMTTQQKVLVIGATGYLGQYMVKALKEAGYWVRALSRTEQRIEPVRTFVDDLFIGEASDPATLSGICKDIDI